MDEWSIYIYSDCLFFAARAPEQPKISIKYADISTNLCVAVQLAVARSWFLHGEHNVL